MTASPTQRGPARNDLRFVYLAPKDILVARVARKCMVQLCEALAEQGADLELISLKIRTVDSEPTRDRSIWDVYGISHRFRSTMIWTPLRQESMDGRIAALMVLFYRLFVYPLYALRAYRRVGPQGSRPRHTVFYSRNYGCATGVLLLRRLLGDRARVILEVHVPPRGRLQTFVLRKVDGVACQSLALQSLMEQRCLARRDRSVGRHNGFSPALTGCSRLTREEARKQLGWSPSDRIACYTGKVYWGMEEVELLLQTAELLAPEGIRLVIVGGRADQVVLWKQEASRRGLSNVDFAGFVAPADALVYQMAADVLLLYYPSGSPLNEFRSPGKLFEYMASGTPAVVSDYPSIREVITHGHNGLLVQPDRPDLLAGSVRQTFTDSALAARLAAQAEADAMLFTWTATARATLSLVDRLWSD